MAPFGFDVGTILGVIVVVIMKTSVLKRYAWLKQDWQQWAVATVVGLAASIAIRILLK